MSGHVRAVRETVRTASVAQDEAEITRIFACGRGGMPRALGRYRRRETVGLALSDYLDSEGLLDMSKQRLGQPGARGRLDRLGARWRELSNHLVEAWFLATTKARTGLLKRVRALRDLSRRR